jgi:hypothetical protein
VRTELERQCPVQWFAVVNTVVICGISSSSVQEPFILSTRELFHELRVTYIQLLLFSYPHQLWLLSLYAYVHVIHYHVSPKKCTVFVQEVKGAFKMYVSYRYSVSYSRGILIKVFLDVIW